MSEANAHPLAEQVDIAAGGIAALRQHIDRLAHGTGAHGGKRHAMAQIGARRKEGEHVEGDIARPDQIAAVEVGVDLAESGVDGGRRVALAHGGAQRDARIVEDLEALRLAAGVEQPCPFPFVQAQADRLAADAERLGDLALADRARETDVAALGNADIVGGIEQPVGERNVAVAQEMGRLDGERRDQPLHRQADEAAADRLDLGENRHKQREGDAVEIAGKKRARRGAADILAVDEAGGNELELAEGLAGNDMLDMTGQPRLAGRQHQLDNAARAGRSGIGREGDEDRVGRIAGLIDRLVALGLPAGARLLRDPLDERRVGSAEQAHGRQDIGNILAIHTVTMLAMRAR